MTLAVRTISFKSTCRDFICIILTLSAPNPPPPQDKDEYSWSQIKVPINFTVCLRTVHRLNDNSFSCVFSEHTTDKLNMRVE